MQLIVFFNADEKLGVNRLKEYIERLREDQIDRSILVLPKKLSGPANTERTLVRNSFTIEDVRADFRVFCSMLMPNCKCRNRCFDQSPGRSASIGGYVHAEIHGKHVDQPTAVQLFVTQLAHRSMSFRVPPKMHAPHPLWQPPCVPHHLRFAGALCSFSRPSCSSTSHGT